MTIGRLLALLVLFAGCGSEGGVTGTGINASVSDLYDSVRSTYLPTKAILTWRSGFSSECTIAFQIDRSGLDPRPSVPRATFTPRCNNRFQG